MIIIWSWKAVLKLSGSVNSTTDAPADDNLSSTALVCFWVSWSDSSMKNEVMSPIRGGPDDSKSER